jgi:nucleoside 2-deoxyribosyltransferase
MSNYKLCYVRNNFAWFTTRRLDQQWGDDWNDVPYEHNAGDPYEYGEHDKKAGKPPWRLKRLAYQAPLETPAQAAGGNSSYSVEDINRYQKTPWLTTCGWGDGPTVVVRAGASIDEFKQAVWSSGGEVFEEVKQAGSPKEELVAYLAGPMEFAEDYGMGWRERLRNELKEFGIRCILPNEEEAKFISSQHELNDIKESDPQRYINIMRQFIKQDLQFVEGVDMIITCWEGERMSGTIGEATHAYCSDQVSYLITSVPFKDIPGWFVACYSEIFTSVEEFLDFARGKYAKTE